MPNHKSGNALGFLLTDVARLFRQQLEKSVLDAGIELTPGEIRTLSHVARNEGSRQAVLAERMGVEPMTLSAYLDRLENRSLVKRSPDPNDRRAKVINTTDQAIEIFERARPIAHDVYNRITQGLSDDERYEIERLLNRVRRNMIGDRAGVHDELPEEASIPIV